ncbi:hypothetical protein B0J15DRAFT_116119 [Fusarium solani]|uniref:Uncharacterized protein n=1 Tax=Fusarium solani TaxID=169388 RepID=A0A9P9RD04_FUSSL|nr:uncharacterized protein B0J15DRAFT_116119 [Fusarium solani]KAH7273983.1 hypothetical protein B0J15DRAFT_116119 [Fusarium solani]
MTSSGHGCYLRDASDDAFPRGRPKLDGASTAEVTARCWAVQRINTTLESGSGSAAQQSRTGNESCAAVVRCGAARRRGAPCISQAPPGLDALRALCCPAWAHSHHGARPGRFDFPVYPPLPWAPTTWWLLGRGPLAALTDCQPLLAGGAQELRLLSSLVFVPLVSRRRRTWLRSNSVHILPVPICESFPRPRSSPRAEKLSPQRCLAISQHQGLSSRPVVVTRPSFPCPASQSNARPPLHPIPRTSASRFSSSRSACFASLHVPHLTPPPSLVLSCRLLLLLAARLSSLVRAFLLSCPSYFILTLAWPVRLRSVAHRRSLDGAT